MKKRKISEELQDYVNQIAPLIKNYPDATAILALDGTLLACSDELLRLHQVKSRKYFLGSNFLRFVVAGDKKKGKRLYNSIIKGKPMRRETFVTRSAKGREFVREVNASLVKGNKSRPSVVIVVLRDVTEKKKVEQELKEAKDWSEQLIDNVPNILVGLGEKSEIIIFNKFAEQLTGYKAKSVLGKRWIDLFVPKKQRKELYRVWNDIMKKELIKHHYVNSILTKKGEELSISWNNTFLKENSRFRMVLSVGKDVTREKDSERILKESEERFKQVVENAQEWVWEVDAKGRYTYSSPVVKHILGYDSKELVGKRHFYDLFHTRERQKLKKAVFEGFAKRKSFSGFVNRNLHKDGTEVWLSTSGVPLIDEQGELIGYRGVDTDITDRKKAEHALKESEARYRAVAESTSDCMKIVELSGNIVYVNEASVRNHGLKDAKAAIGKKLWEIPPLVISRQVKKDFIKAKMCCLTNAEYSIPMPDGKNKYIFRTYSPIKDDAGKVTSIHVQCRNITAQKRAYEELKKVDELKSNILRDVSHELKTPISVISMANSLLADELKSPYPDGQKIHKYLDAIKRNAKIFNSHLSSIVELSRLQATGSIKKELTDICALLKEVAASQASLARSKGIDLKLTLDKGPKISVNPVMISMLFRNLIRNAIKFTLKGSVKIACSCRKERTAITVTDTGIGVPRHQQETIFIPFSQVDPSTEGLGVGLAICKKVIELHDIELRFDSRINKGSKFTIIFPINTR